MTAPLNPTPPPERLPARPDARTNPWSAVIDYLVNRRWLGIAAALTTALGIIVEVLESLSDTALEVEGLGFWQAAPVIMMALGQLKANSNRYLDDVIESFDDPTAQDV